MGMGLSADSLKKGSRQDSAVSFLQPQDLFINKI